MRSDSKRKKHPAKPASYIVTMECTVRKSVVVENCTEEQAEEDPFNYAVEEVETEQIDWKVLKVEPNV